MYEVKLNKDELLEIVKKNLDKHVADYEEAVEDYKKAVLTVSHRNYKLAKSGDPDKFKEIRMPPSAPKSHEDQYVRAIRMLELSVDKEVTLTDDQFSQLVLDEWSWKKDFVVSSALYKTMS